MEVNKVYCGDCLDVLKTLPGNSVDSICCDPPYELGFMGKSWDNTGIANNKDMWAECLRVLKTGGHLLAFSGTRTYHRMACAIEDAGFEVRDMIEWVYGSGFPKSLNIGKAVDKLQGNEREVTRVRTDGNKGGGVNTYDDDNYVWDKPFEETKGTSAWEGWGTALKPAHEPICMARKPLDRWWKIKDDGKKVMGRVMTVAENCLKWGTGGINIDESRVSTNENTGRPHYDKEGFNCYGKYNDYVSETHSQGRFPANLILGADENGVHEEVRECFPETKPTKPHGGDGGKLDTQEMGWGFKRMSCDLSDNSGNASRFFKSILYYPKASKSERNKGCENIEEKQTTGGGGLTADLREDGSLETASAGGKYGSIKAKQSNNHPTVKPIALMEYLIKMITPKGGTVLDPFAGSGSTLVAAKQNGFQYIGIELTEEYIPIIEARLNSPTQDKLL